jgi:hypothetical protein
MKTSLTKRLGSGFLTAAMASLIANASAAAPAAPQGVITVSKFLDISGTAIANLTDNAKFPDHPDQVSYAPYFEMNASGDINVPAVDTADNYGGQIRGYFYAPSTGDYVFYIASDDNGNLYLSADDNPANKKLIAQEAGYSGIRSYTAIGGTSTVEAKCSQTFAGTEWPVKDIGFGGAKITLQANKAYYIEALFKEGTGGDNLSVAVQDPNGAIDVSMPIPGTYLSSFDKASGPLKMLTQPASQTINEGEPVTFSVTNDGTPPYTYQWSKNGAAIPDATNVSYTISRVSRADNGANFKVAVSGPSGSASSDEATLTVNPDSAPPSVVLASTSLGKTVKVEFSEYMDGASATNTANYSIPNVTITDAVLSDNGMTVSLAITGTLPSNFEVTLNGIKDFAGNSIAANTKVPGYTTGLTPSMVSYWPLDKIEGTKTPDVISGYDLNLENMSPSNLVDGHAGKCFEFDNASKRLLKRVHNSGDALPIYKNKAFTVSIWVNGPVQGDHRVYCESSSKANSPMFSLGTHNGGADGTLDTYIRNDSGTVTGDHHHHVGVPFDDTWHHICYVQDTNATPKAIVYIDGVRDTVNPDPIWPISADTTTIGAVQRATAAAWFTGKIDDVAVWSRALDVDEVNYLFTRGTPIPPPKVLPLVISSFTPEYPAVAKGDSVTLRWDVSKDATSIEIQPEIGDVTAKTLVGVGSIAVTLPVSKTYVLTVKRGKDTIAATNSVAAIDGIASGWYLLDNFDRYPVGVLPKPWGVNGAGITVVDVNGNRMVATTGDAVCGLPIPAYTVVEGDQRTLFARFYLAQTMTAGAINVQMGISDKGIRAWADATGDMGPDVAFQNTDGSLLIGTRNGNGSAIDVASFTLDAQTPYNLWIDMRNDSIAEGDLFTVSIAKEGDSTRTELFKDYRSDRNPNDTTLLGPTTPNLDMVIIAANTASSKLYFDDFYLTKSGYATTLPRAYGFTTPFTATVEISTPTIANARKDGANFKFEFATQNAIRYVIEYSDTMTGWQTLKSVTGDGAVYPFSEPSAEAKRFYRVKAQN